MKLSGNWLFNRRAAKPDYLLPHNHAYRYLHAYFTPLSNATAISCDTADLWQVLLYLGRFSVTSRCHSGCQRGIEALLNPFRPCL